MDVNPTVPSIKPLEDMPRYYILGVRAIEISKMNGVPIIQEEGYSLIILRRSYYNKLTKTANIDALFMIGLAIS